MTSPYDGVAVADWPTITAKLVAVHPLDMETVLAAVERSWAQIFVSSIGRLRVGRDIYPQPQIMGFFLHELIPTEVATMVPGWRRGSGKSEKDLHYVTDPSCSVEIKTSSHPTKIFGNRSYAQAPTVGSSAKAGYYLAVNFAKFDGAAPPVLTRVRFGWLDHSDWRGQTASTGQQASVLADADRHKFVELLAQPPRRR